MRNQEFEIKNEEIITNEFIKIQNSAQPHGN